MSSEVNAVNPYIPAAVYTSYPQTVNTSNSSDHTVGTVIGVVFGVIGFILVLCLFTCCCGTCRMRQVPEDTEKGSISIRLPSRDGPSCRSPGHPKSQTLRFQSTEDVETRVEGVTNVRRPSMARLQGMGGGGRGFIGSNDVRNFPMDGGDYSSSSATYASSDGTASAIPGPMPPGPPRPPPYIQPTIPRVIREINTERPCVDAEIFDGVIESLVETQEELAKQTGELLQEERDARIFERWKSKLRDNDLRRDIIDLEERTANLEHERRNSNPSPEAPPVIFQTYNTCNHVSPPDGRRSGSAGNELPPDRGPWPGPTFPGGILRNRPSLGVSPPSSPPSSPSTSAFPTSLYPPSPGSGPFRGSERVTNSESSGYATPQEEISPRIRRPSIEFPPRIHSPPRPTLADTWEPTGGVTFVEGEEPGPSYPPQFERSEGRDRGQSRRRRRSSEEIRDGRPFPEFGRGLGRQNSFDRRRHRRRSDNSLSPPSERPRPGRGLGRNRPPRGSGESPHVHFQCQEDFEIPSPRGSDHVDLRNGRRNHIPHRRRGRNVSPHGTFGRDQTHRADHGMSDMSSEYNPEIPRRTSRRTSSTTAEPPHYGRYRDIDENTHREVGNVGRMGSMERMHSGESDRTTQPRGREGSGASGVGRDGRYNYNRYRF